MSDSLSDFEDENNWILDLETALLEKCDFFKLRSICLDRSVPKHLRHDVWKICLNVNNSKAASSSTSVDSLDSFNDVFDLPNQDILHDSCCQFVAGLPKDLFANSIGFINDIESVLTFYSRRYNVPFHPDNGWLSIIRVLCCELKLNKRHELYQFFTSICHRFLPSFSVMSNEIFCVFRLLVQYHDPDLCSFLDTCKISPELYAYTWFSSLFSEDITHDALVQLWDIYFLIADPFLMFYISLIVVLNLKETLFELKGTENRPAILRNIKSVLQNLVASDVADLHSLAQHYVSLTPKSFVRLFSSILFGNGNKDKETQIMLDSLCMPINVHELLENKMHDCEQSPLRFFLVDCRPAEAYNYGHLSSAYFLDSSLIISSPSEEFQTSVTSLLATQQQALDNNSESAGVHICFLGSGDVEEDRIVHMVVAQFLQKMTHYVSMVYGGYRAIHDVLGPQCDTLLVGHNTGRGCTVCSKLQISGGLREMKLEGSYKLLDNSGKKMGGLISKMSIAIKNNSSKFKEKINNYVKNEEEKPQKLGHVGKSSSNKPYRNTGNIFSIEDDGDDEYEPTFLTENKNIPVSTTKPEVIGLDTLINKPDFLDKFECYVVDDDGTMHPGFLILMEVSLIILRKSASSLSMGMSIQSKSFNKDTSNTDDQKCKTMVVIHKKRPLNTVVKITSRKKLPECLTFHYIMPDDTVEKDRYLVDKAGEAAKVIKIQVQKLLDEAEFSGFGLTDNGDS